MKEKIIKNLIPIAIIVAGIIVAGAFFYTSQVSLNDIGTQKASEKTINYINDNLLEPGTTASIVDISDVGSVYKVSLEIKEDETVLGQFDSYITKDGDFLFPEGYNMDEPLDLGAEVTDQPEMPDLSEEELNQFVGCLEKEGFVVYGEEGCPYCAQLIALFGGRETIDPIYVDCQEQGELCQEKEITAVPAIFVNDEEYSGPISFEGFAQETGCIIN